MDQSQIYQIHGFRIHYTTIQAAPQVLFYDLIVHLFVFPTTYTCKTIWLIQFHHVIASLYYNIAEPYGAPTKRETESTAPKSPQKMKPSTRSLTIQRQRAAPLTPNVLSNLGEHQQSFSEADQVSG